MGVEIYITRAEYWAENEHSPITAQEWLACIEADPELELQPRQGEHHARWHGRSSYEEPWLDWAQGNVHTKWPDTALYLKMLQVAAALGAHVQDEEGTVYAQPGDWEFEPRR